jgi:hypothetical protein
MKNMSWKDEKVGALAGVLDFLDACMKSIATAEYELLAPAPQV